MSYPSEVRARVAYTARNAQEMSLTAGETYTVTGQDPTGQWYKTTNPATNATAWIPMSYCEKVEGGAAPAAASPVAGRGRGVPMPGMGDIASALANRGNRGGGGGGPAAGGASPGTGRAAPAPNTGGPAAMREPSMSTGAQSSPGPQRTISGAPPGRGAPMPGMGGPPGRANPPTGGGPGATGGGPPGPGRSGPSFGGGPPTPGGGPPLRASGGPPQNSSIGGPPGRTGPPTPGGGPPVSGGPPIGGGRGIPPPTFGGGRGNTMASEGSPRSVSSPRKDDDEETYEIDDTPEEAKGYKWGGVGDRNDGYQFAIERDREEKARKDKLAAMKAAKGPVAPKEAKPLTAEQQLAAAYAYVPQAVQEPKKDVDPDDPFGEIELIEWGTKKRRY